MENSLIMKEFLSANDFKIVENLESESFGDTYAIYSDGNILIKVVKDRSIISIHISSNNDQNVSFDLPLITALIRKEDDLRGALTETEQYDFLSNHFTQIRSIFNPANYISSKTELQILQKKRVQQMFNKKH